MSETAEPPRCDWCPPHAAHTSSCGALEVDQFGSFTGRDCDCEARDGASTEATERPDLRAAYDHLRREVEAVCDAYGDKGWAKSAMVRRLRAALTGASPSEPSREEPSDE